MCRETEVEELQEDCRVRIRRRRRWRWDDSNEDVLWFDVSVNDSKWFV
jgi:hypothetical protein